MIDRLTVTLRQLVTLPPAELETAAAVRLRRDCADAVRLELDCPQLALTSHQRHALTRLSDALEQSTTPGREIVAAARDACAALALTPVRD